MAECFVAILTLLPLKNSLEGTMDYFYIFPWIGAVYFLGMTSILSIVMFWFQLHWREYALALLLPISASLLMIYFHRFPFNFIITTLCIFPFILIIFIFALRGKLTVKEHRSKLIASLLCGFALPTFFLISGGYIILFSYAKTTMQQLPINITFGVIKYVLKRALFRSFYRHCGSTPANFINFVMETVHQLFSSIIFIGKATLATLIITLSLEFAIYIRTGLGTTDRYQRTKKKLISWLHLTEIDRFMSNTMFPTSEINIKQQRVLQINWLCMAIYANIVSFFIRT